MVGVKAGKAIMTSLGRHRGWISKTRLGTASAALTVAVVLLLGLVTIQSAQAQTFNDLYNFMGSPDGEYPLAGLVRDAAGNLYGTTVSGGAYGGGTVFKWDTSGTETLLYSFCPGGYPCTDGQGPESGVIRDSAGNLYGTTYYGGAYTRGTVFKVDTSGTETVLYSFCSTQNCPDGNHPYGGLIRDAAGNFYGGAAGGGAYDNGVVFKLDTSGTETVLHSFAGGPRDGVGCSGLVFDKAGNIYGASSGGGPYSQGVVFKLASSSGWPETILYTFSGGDNGGNPDASVILDTKGNLYGTTCCGGAYDVGVVFRLKPSKKGQWGISVLHSFTGSNDGGYPYAPVTFDKAGNLYGTTSYGGYYEVGTVFKLTPSTKRSWNETLLHSFAGSDGELPVAGVVRDAKGSIYGTASGGGTYGYGTVWKLTP